MRFRLLAFTFAVGCPLANLPAAVAQDDSWKASYDKAVTYLKGSQNADGSWSPAPANRGVTGIIVTGLLRNGMSPDDEPAARGLKFIESLVNEKEGHIAGQDANPGLTNY